MSPRMALRRWPTCAALLGLMLECSTRILPAGMFGPRLFVGDQSGRQFFALEAGVDVSRARQFQLLESWDRANPVDNLFRNLARSLAQLLGQLKGEGQGVLAKLDFGWLLDDDFGQIEIE